MAKCKNAQKVGTKNVYNIENVKAILTFMKIKRNLHVNNMKHTKRFT